MARLSWENSQKTYEAGIDRGVLYLEDGRAIPWPGLVSVNETSTPSVTSVFYDGLKINDLIANKVFSGTITAFTYPNEFEECEGFLTDSTGVTYSGQNGSRFHLSFRTKIVNDVTGEEDYKIHVVYNLAAVQTERLSKSLSLEIEPTEFSWNVTSISEQASGIKPTAHIIFDSRKLSDWFLSDIEEVLYGSDTRDPALPSLEGFATFLRKYDRIIIQDNNDGSWSAYTDRPDTIILVGNGEFQIVDANAVVIDPNTYEISSTVREDEDIWQQ